MKLIIGEVSCEIIQFKNILDNSLWPSASDHTLGMYECINKIQPVVP